MIEQEQRTSALALAAVLSAAFVLVGRSVAATPTQEPEEDKIRFANPELLLETDWLAEHLEDASLRIVDVRSAREYGAGHVPGAVSIPRSVTFDPKGPSGTVGRPEQIAALFGSKGIDENVRVLLYDEGRSTAAARVFWTLEYYGHPNVSVLDGGFAKWQTEERAMTREEPQVRPVTFKTKPSSSKLSTKERMLGEVGKATTGMVDARSAAEYRGEAVRSKRSGHVPGAVHIEWTKNYTGSEVPVFKSAAELTKLYDRAGVTRDKSVHAY